MLWCSSYPYRDTLAARVAPIQPSLIRVFRSGEHHKRQLGPHPMGQRSCRPLGDTVRHIYLGGNVLTRY